MAFYLGRRLSRLATRGPAPADENLKSGSRSVVVWCAGRGKGRLSELSRWAGDHGDITHSPPYLPSLAGDRV